MAAFAAAHIDAVYEAIDVRLEESVEVMRRLRESHYAGWNITTPLKEVLLPHVDSVTDEAQAVGAMNVVRREVSGTLRGHNTDGAGMLYALRELPDWNAGTSTVLILGSGPAARAIAMALRDNVSKVYCWSRTAQRAEQVAPPPKGEVNVLISALPPDAVVPDHVFSHISPRTTVVDINYGTVKSPIARLRGDRFHSGEALLLHQGALSFEWWTGRPAPLDVMRAALYGGA